MGGGLPQQFRRWSWYGSGGQSYQLPPMPGVVKAFETPRSYTWAMFQGYAPRFDYREFIWNQFSQFFWRSWSLYASQFVAKEETVPPANATSGN